eukprot:178638_1
MAASLSDGQQNSLITEFKSNTKTSWRQVMTKVTRDNQPHSHLTKQQFEEGLPLQTQSLIDALWNEIKALDDQQNDETLPRTTITQWISNDNKPYAHTKMQPSSQTETSLNWDSVSDLSDCTSQHLVHIVDKHVFDALVFRAKELKNLFDENRGKIIECIQTNQIDGKQLQSRSISRKQFASTLCTYCGTTKLNATCLKLYTAITKFDVTSLTGMRQRNVALLHAELPLHSI